jgi:CelD/BcsL family acetyltransferase involved in cellulose biosynthesis
MELDGKPIAARVVMSTGDELSMWNSGFDDEYSKFSPSVISMVRAVADGVDGRDELHVGLGPGGQAYKYRVSNEDDALTTYVLLPFGRGYPLARARLAVAQLRQRMSERLSPNAKRRLRGLLGLAG